MIDNTHLWIPDTQVKPGVPINHFYWLAYYAMDKAPDAIIWAMDHWDFPSLSSYDKKGSRRAEGRRVRRDVDAGHNAMRITQSIWDKAGFKPRQDAVMGNHENRYYRALEDDPAVFDGMYENNDPFKLDGYGIQAHEFLKPVTIDGIRYAHFFPHSARGQVTQTKRGAPNAMAQIQRQMTSATAGHQQGLDTSVVSTPDGMRRGLIAGSFYLHDEEYLGPLNNYWRGLILKHNVYRGNYNLCEVDIRWLRDKYRKYEPAGRKVA